MRLWCPQNLLYNASSTVMRYNNGFSAHGQLYQCITSITKNVNPGSTIVTLLVDTMSAYLSQLIIHSEDFTNTQKISCNSMYSVSCLSG